MIALATVVGMAAFVLGAALMIHIRAPILDGEPAMAVATHPYVGLGFVVWLVGALFVVAFGLHASTLGNLVFFAERLGDAQGTDAPARAGRRRVA
jgi:hypothetical protein